MLRSLLRASAACAFAALIAPATPSAAPPPGIAFDEIVRVVVNATPPPPGNFQADVAALNAAQAAAPVSPSPAPRRRGIGIGAIAGAIAGGGGAANVGGALAGDAISGAMENALEASLGAQFGALGAAVRGFLTPHLLRYAYWNGWERVDDLTGQTATIRKCDAGQVIKLDLAAKTYAVYDPSAEPTATPAPMPARRGRTAPAEPAQPGTAVATLNETTRSLGSLRIENQPTTGFDTATTFATTQSTGSCRDASATIETVQYLSALPRPAVNACPIRRPPLPTTAGDVVTAPSGGCRPSFSAQRSGPTPPANRLALYSLVTFSGGRSGPAPSPGPGGGLGFLTERGNLKTLGAADVGLFGIPAGFTKLPQ